MSYLMYLAAITTLALLVLTTTAWPAPLQSVFTYQGELQDAGTPANGTYDLRFIVYDSALGGSQLGPIITNAFVEAVNGLPADTWDGY